MNGNTHTLALKTDGTLWAWGQNAFGQLGDGTTATRSTPVQVGTGFARISAGGTHSLAIKTDGTLWAWGGNVMAQTGLGVVTATTLNADQHTPQAVALSNVVSGGISGQGSLNSLTLGVQLRPVAPSVGQTGHAFVVAAVPGGALFAFNGTTWVPFDAANPAAWKTVTSCLSTVCTTIQTAPLLDNADVSVLQGTRFFLGYGFGNDPLASMGEMLGSGRFKLSYTIASIAAPVVVGTSKLPDTGITAAQCYAAESDALVSCTSAAAIALNPKQDGMVGHDVTQSNYADGKLGFSYSTVGSYSKEECVKDNITGLTWEGKPTTGLRAASNIYTNFGDNRTGDASAYVAAVNAAQLCGHSNWRLPTADELQGLVDYSVAHPGPTIDGTWFPNTPQSSYWTGTGVAGAGGATVPWLVVFTNGYVGGFFGPGNHFYVRLVR